MRLNPNVPWKTRGNAALSACFGRGHGRRRDVGVVGGRSVVAFDAGRAASEALERRLADRLWESVLATSQRGVEGTDPTLVVVPRRLPAALYWAAVRRIVDRSEARREIDRVGGTIRHDGSDRGIVGAAASLAWPGHHPTWELIAYRSPTRVGLRRSVDADRIRALESEHPGLFLCTDPRTRRLLVAPHTACPILFGLRSTDRVGLPGLLGQVRSEPVERWMVFVTNQGTGDHLARRDLDAVGPYDSAWVRGRVRDPPVTLRGGHVQLVVEDAAGHQLSCLAFEPTKTLPAVARSLVPGDRVAIWGGRADDPTFRVEGIVLEHLRPRFAPARPPRCPSCHATTGSMGTGRGYRCRGCRRRFPPESGRGARRPPEFPTGVYHPTPSARRHLAPRGPGAPRPVRVMDL